MRVTAVLTPTGGLAAEVVARAPETSWQWPIDVTAYDRSPQLTAQESRALARIGDGVRAWPWLGRQQPAWRARARPVRPLADARALVISESQRQRRCADAAVAAILRQCLHKHSTYWAWSMATWVHILGATKRAFRALHPAWVDRRVRPYLIALPYLLGCLTDLRPLGNYKRGALAEKVFGPARVADTVARVAGVLVGWGYLNAQTGRPFPQLLCEVLLLNRSPHIQDLSPALLDDLRRTAGAEKRSLLFQLQLALSALGVMDPPPAPVVPRPTVEGVPARWQTWVHRWETTSTLAPATRRQVHLCLLKAGRWLAAEHPAIELHLEPADLGPGARGSYCYPVELVRALAVTWLFSGLRSDEIARLRTGCVRWQSSSEALLGPVCLLDVPAHKTGAPFTKPVDPLVGRAIEAWEAVRPVGHQGAPISMDDEPGRG